MTKRPTPPTFGDNILDHQGACFAHLMVCAPADELRRAVTDIVGAVVRYHKTEEAKREKTLTLVFEWDCSKGLVDGLAVNRTSQGRAKIGEFLQWLCGPWASETERCPSNSIVLAWNMHRHATMADSVQQLQNFEVVGQNNRITMVWLCPPETKVVPELRPTRIPFELPSRADFERIIGEIVQTATPEDAERVPQLARVAMGLTQDEAVSVTSLSLARHGRIVEDEMWVHKRALVEQSAGLRLYESPRGFQTLAGMDALKAHCLRLYKRENHAATPLGLILLGTPGIGKSEFARCLGTELGLPTLILNLGDLYGGTVGKSEEQMADALARIRAFGPSVVMLDEIEKDMSGMGSLGDHDSGVANRMGKKLLNFLDEANRPPGTIIVATSNDISRVPTEYLRSGRWDGIYYVPMPNPDERAAIWAIHCELRGIDPDQMRPDDRAWTGAEIADCCRQAALAECSLIEAADYVLPIDSLRPEAMQYLEKWAAGHALDARCGGRYRGTVEIETGAAPRRVRLGKREE